jgi:hypothetical protein
MSTDSERKGRAFQEQASRAKGSGPLREVWYLLARTRKWWLAPVILSLFMVGVLLVMGGTAAGPLIYALF